MSLFDEAQAAIVEAQVDDPREWRVDIYSNAIPDALPHVRVTHMPSGMVESNGDTHSQLINRKRAVDAIKARLAE